MIDALPPNVEFPVYGLDDTFAGPRNLDVWNRLTTPDGPIYEVVLGHGEIDSPDRVVVITVPTLPAHPTFCGSVGPTGLGDARRLALLEMVLRGSADDPQALPDLARRAGEDDGSFEDGTVTITIDGTRAELPLSFYRDGAATYADLGTVTIAVHGGTSAFAGLSLVPVNDRLNAYQPVPADETFES